MQAQPCFGAISTVQSPVHPHTQSTVPDTGKPQAPAGHYSTNQPMSQRPSPRPAIVVTQGRLLQPYLVGARGIVPVHPPISLRSSRPTSPEAPAVGSQGTLDISTLNISYVRAHRESHVASTTRRSGRGLTTDHLKTWD